MDYKTTLNLPKTAFPMKANLIQSEPQMLAWWEQIGIYKRLREVAADRPMWILHDGPPYANGHIHLGHVLNKVLKDVIVKARTRRSSSTSSARSSSGSASSATGRTRTSRWRPRTRR
jgi:isoleucyl-tRNA synthetase